MSCTSCKQFGGGTSGAPLSYSNPNYQEPSASAGSNRLGSEPLLARPSLNHTGGKRYRKCTRKHKHTRKCLTKSRKGGFYPSVMGGIINNGSRLVPAAAVQGYRMVRNYNKTRKNRK